MEADSITLRPYQQECLTAIAAKGSGAYLCRLATGMGKTVIFTHLPFHGRMLILSHREELVQQPLKYFRCTTGVEQGAQHARRGRPWSVHRCRALRAALTGMPPMPST